MGRYESPSASNKDYVAAVGQAIYSFSSMEWNIISIALRLDKNFVEEDMYQMTSGRVIGKAKKTIEANLMKFSTPIQERMMTVSEKAVALVALRNDLIHTYPCTSPENLQVLTRRKSGNQELWYLANIDDAIKSFDETSSELSDLLHHHMPD